MATNTMDMGSASIPKLLFRLSVPAILAQLINALYNIVDRMYIGRMPDVGTTALTGVGITFPMIMLISAFAALVGMGGAPLASIAMGSKEQDKAEKILGNCITLLLGISVVLTAFFLLFKTDLLYLFGASDNTFSYANDYMTIYVLGTISVQFALGLNPFINAQGFAKTGMLTVAIGAVINIALDPVFIFTLNMGVKGAAWATILSQTVSALWVVRFLLSKKSILKVKPVNLKPDWRIYAKVVSLGLSPFVMQSTESLVQIVFNTSLKRYGNDDFVGAIVILTSIMQFLLLPLTGMTQGAQPIIGYNFGAKQYDRVKQTVKYTLINCLIFSTTMWVILVFFPQVFIYLFTDKAYMIEFTAPYSRIFFFGIFIMGAQMCFQNAFIALGQAKFSIMLALLRKIVLLIPLVFILPLIVSPATTGVFLAEPVADILAGTSTTLLFVFSTRRLLRDPAASASGSK